MKEAATPEIRAAGALVWRKAKNKRGIEVLVVHRPRYNDWSWPKGKPDNDERMQVTAVREVGEETGIPIVLGQPLGTVRYKNGGGRSKVASYWAATVTSDKSILATRGGNPDKDDEVDEQRWVSPENAARLLTYPHDRKPLGHLLDQWDDSRLDTWMVQLLRHARARKRSAFKGEEKDRPLTAGGRSQAAELIPLMSAYGVSRIISSPWMRCFSSVQPYSELAGLETMTEAILTETAYERDPEPVRQLIAEEMRAPRITTTVCVHRPLLPTVLDALTEHTPYRLMSKIPDVDPYLMTAESLMVHLAPRNKKGPVAVAIERVRPPS